MSDLSLYATIAMCLTIGVLLSLFVMALADRPIEPHVAPIEPIVAAARADQLRRAAVLGTPTDEQPIVAGLSLPPRGAGVVNDLAPTGRHRRVIASVMASRPSLATLGLNEALAWLAVDRVKREAEHAQFQVLLASYQTS